MENDQDLEKFAMELQEQILELTSTAPNWRQKLCGALWLIISARKVRHGKNITGSLNLNSSGQIVIGAKR